MRLPKFSQESFSKLATCHPDLQVLFYEVIKYFDCTILEGYRNQEAQEKAFADGHSKLHYPHGKHNHHPSRAVDVIPYPVTSNIDRLGLWFGGYVMGVAQILRAEGKMAHSIRWGGSWDGLGKMNDAHMLNGLVHFELID